MLSLPDSSCQVSSGHSKPDSSFSSFKLACLFGQALDLLVSVRLTCHHAYTPDLSTLSSLRGLTCLRNGKSHLEVGFTLRCLQRLSLPHLATQLCHWNMLHCHRISKCLPCRCCKGSACFWLRHNIDRLIAILFCRFCLQNQCTV